MRVLIAVPCLLAGVWLIFRSLRSIVRGVRSHSWPGTRGVITASKVVKKFNADPAGATEVWREDLEYSYSVAGFAYSGKRIRFGVPSSLLWSSLPARPLGVGKQVDVLYDPALPHVSALNPGFHGFALVPLIAGALTAAFGGWLLIPLVTAWA